MVDGGYIRMAVLLPSGASTPAIGLGTFPFSGVFSPVDSSTVADILKSFFSGGGWYIETAPVYAPNGIDLGTLLKPYPRESFFLATKCVTGKDADGTTIRSGKASHIRGQLHTELRRLGVEHLDLLQLHIVPEDAGPEESFGTLLELQHEGFVRNIGVSNVHLSQLKSFAAVGSVDFVQNRFSYLHRSEHHEIQGFCEANGILLNPFQVIERGLLTDNPPLSFREGDLRNSKYEYTGDVYHLIRSWVLSELKPIADSAGLSITTLALGWALAQPAIGVVPVGATRSGQISSNLTSAATPIPSDVRAEMEAAYTQLEATVRERVGLSLDEYRGL
jgi:aryl-alcohol dehydrogenase-like predicted oxidoreductase